MSDLHNAELVDWINDLNNSFENEKDYVNIDMFILFNIKGLTDLTFSSHTKINEFIHGFLIDII